MCHAGRSEKQAKDAVMRLPNTMKLPNAFVLLGSLIVGAQLLPAADPPANGLGIHKILEVLNQAGYRDVTEISYDDGRWEVEALKDAKPVGIALHPGSGEILQVYPDEPHPSLPSGGIGLPAIVARLEKDGYTIRKIDFEATGWEVEARQQGGWRELAIDLNGKVVANRPND
jgi:hypothetical protein